MIKKKICIVTGSRSEYSLLYWLMREINADNNLDLQIVATGMHLSTEFGNTYKNIENDGFFINKKIHMLISSDADSAISKSIGIGMIGFADAFSDLKPDLLIVLGDRFEIFSAVSAAMIAKIPVAHLHGGEVTEGAFDEYIRHSITKMSHLHFTATEEYKARVIQLGEQPNKVFNVGGLGVDNIKKIKLLSRVDFEKVTGVNLDKRNILVTFHPATLERSTSEFQFKELLNSISKLKNTKIIFTKSNSDTDGRVINNMIDNYVYSHDNAIAFMSMGRINYLSALQFVDAVVGNSSSGLAEAPSFNIGTINIGDRQKGRIEAESVISCQPKEFLIDSAMERLYTLDFQNILKEVDNPYGTGGASEKIIKIIKTIKLDNILKKTFYDIK